MSAQTLRLVSLNVNGIRAAFRKGMQQWLDENPVDVLALQEVRASTEDLTRLFGAEWHIIHDECAIKGRAGVALVSKIPFTQTSTHLDYSNLDSSGRWIEGHINVAGKTIQLASVYVPSGEVDTPKQVHKYAFFDALSRRMRTLKSDPYVAVLGDFNVGHRKLDIKNWKGNLKRAGFLPQERAYFDEFLGAEDDPLYNNGAGLGWVDTVRSLAGEQEGPYTWWSWRGKAFDNDTGWRIDYHLTTSRLAAYATTYTIAKAPSWDTRWSDHAPVVVDYALALSDEHESTHNV